MTTAEGLKAASLMNKQTCIKTLEVIYLARFMDEKMAKLVRQNKGGTFHLPSQGHEMIGALSALMLTPGKDWGFPYYRDRTFAIGIGCSLSDLLGASLARAIPHHSGGRMMPDHFSHKQLRLPCQSSCVGSQFLQAVGVAKGIQLAALDEVVYVSAGDGATSQGDFHEALNFASLHKLSIVFVIQDNGWAISVPISEQVAGKSIAERSSGFKDLTIFDVDGCDFEEVYRATSSAVEKGRARLGPSLIVANVPRIGAHSNSDDPKKYKEEEVAAEDEKRDPLLQFENWLLARDIMTRQELEEIRLETFERIEQAALLADQLPFPDSSTAANFVFKETADCIVHEENSSCGEEAIVIMDAINHALDEEMERDSGVILFGQDVAHGKGGVFGISRHLTQKYGEDRCFNTPLAESTIIALAIGISIVGNFKPVAEIQFADYMWTGINQLFNELASFHYRSNGEWNCPLVIRMPYGGYIQGGPYHSQSVEAFLAHCPGLKVVIPSNASDAKKLLKTAIRDPNPVIFLEHKALYRQRLFCARNEPEPEELLPFGKAHIVRKGSDLTLVAWGMMVVMASEVAEKLSHKGIAVEIIDLRTIVPLDKALILESVRKTGKLLIAHEAPRTCGFGAEIAALVSESAFDYLDAPIVRVTGLDTPVPYSKILEEEVLPQRHHLEEAIYKLARF